MEMKLEYIVILEQMLCRMKEGTLGCSGFNITETDVFKCAIDTLKELKLKTTTGNTFTPAGVV